MIRKSSILVLWMIASLLSVSRSLDEYSVLTIALGLCFAAFMSAPLRRLQPWVAMALLLVSLKLPGLLIFYPIFLATVLDPQKPASALVFLPLLMRWGVQADEVLASVIMILAALSLAWKDNRYGDLKQRYDNYFSSSRSLQDELLNLNRQIMESQNRDNSMILLQERNRIARDIHDGVGHMISRGILQLGALFVTAKDSASKEALEELKETLQLSMQQLRKSVHNLVEEELDLQLALQEVVDHFNFCPLQYTYALNHQFELADRYSILFIVKEALNNIARHSKADKAWLSLRESEDYVFLLIRDDGEQANIKNYGMGIYSINNRVEQMQGSIDMTQSDGFRIFITLNKKREDRNENSHRG